MSRRQAEPCVVPSQLLDLDPDQVREPSSVTLLGTGAEYNVSGVVSLDSADEANTDPNIMRLVAMHELSHVVGLGHSSDPSELMAPVLDWQTGFGPGDLAALAIAGAGPCTEDV